MNCFFGREDAPFCRTFCVVDDTIVDDDDDGEDEDDVAVRVVFVVLVV